MHILIARIIKHPTKQTFKQSIVLYDLLVTLHL